ncbi:penicillin-binding protein 2 [Aestuariicella hydrocarbonica]|uniref:Peptidoglycan D,D-transpeptidase FtsI n=2 Tax=Pseudomaricurvus hydrocarbonicus TaxID=1470433 RepID=A0A9E5JTM0_9GAMM|nr:penicillin-binding transpeptidase domain-containing protein [Aestuariicella hydrocarbonica]NHO65074.1 penicillin-binding protein 2 [Aestuariicella hydrocarbonica]
MTIPRWRFSLAVLLLAVLMAVLLWHVALLQVVPGEDKGFEFLQGQGDARTVRTEVIPAHRGVITDRNGEPLAVSTPVTSLWANPSELAADAVVVAALAKALSMDEKALRKKLKRYQGKEFIYLKRHLPPQEAESILANRWPGVYGRTEYQRFYPAGEVAAHVVGFTNIDENGQEGLELAFNAWLEGRSGSKRVLKDLKGRIIKDDGELKAPETGKDVHLSIDLRMQYLAHRELKQAVAENNAASGSLVMLDTHTGEVLAMVNQPSYNPNARKGIRTSALRNRAITDQFEPGSTMKPLTVLAALETGRYHPHTMIDTNPGYIRVGKKTLLDHKNYGVIDLTKVITKSSQVGISKVALDMEPDVVRNMFSRLGLGQGTGVGFPGESVGLLPNRSRWTPIEQANFAFGYGMTVTALQLAQAYSVVANLGVKKPVSLLRQDVAPGGEQAVGEAISGQVIDMLKTVLQPGGTARRAQIETYPAAGKTGTVHKVGKDGYADDRYRSVFAGMAPAEDPRIVVVVVIEEPNTGKYYGGEVAAPIFAKVAEGALRLMHVPPKVVPGNEKVAFEKKSPDKFVARGPLS